MPIRGKLVGLVLSIELSGIDFRKQFFMIREFMILFCIFFVLIFQPFYV